MTGGGILPENVHAVQTAFCPDFIDVMTGIETAPGRKSEKKIQKLMQALPGNCMN